MRPRNSIWSPFEGCWRTALTAREWAERFGGPVPTAFTRWFVPGPRARYVPCIHPEGCRHPHRATCGRDGQWHAIPESPDCETFEIAATDTDTTQLDLALVARDLAATASLEPTPVECLNGQSHVLLIGRIGKRGCPCFLALSASSADLATACDIVTAHHPGGSVVLAPNETHATETLRSLVRLRGGSLLALPEVVALDPRGELIPRAAIGERSPGIDFDRVEPTSASAHVLGGRTCFARGNTWPHARPDNPKWSDVILAMHPQELAISFGESQAKLDYRDIDGFTDHRGGKKPNRLWMLLLGFAMKDGILPLPTKSKDPVRVRTLADLDRVLCRFLGIKKSAFERDSLEQCVRVRFRLRYKP